MSTNTADCGHSSYNLCQTLVIQKRCLSDMTNQEIAIKYLNKFCKGEIDDLEPLLAPDFSFTGTLNSYSSAKKYLASLRDDPPELCDYNVISITENDDFVGLFYEYVKPDQVMRIAQLFKIKNQLIHEVLLVFDGRGFE